jgi:hypothetical protein
MAKTGYIGKSSSATVCNIVYWSRRGYSTAAAGVWGCQCHAINKPVCISGRKCNRLRDERSKKQQQQQQPRAITQNL